MLAFARRTGCNSATIPARVRGVGTPRGVAAAAGEDVGAAAVRPQHRFDEAALDAYLRHELPWIGTQPISIRQFTHGQSNPVRGEQGGRACRRSASLTLRIGSTSPPWPADVPPPPGGGPAHSGPAQAAARQTLAGRPPRGPRAPRHGGAERSWLRRACAPAPPSVRGPRRDRHLLLRVRLCGGRHFHGPEDAGGHARAAAGRVRRHGGRDGGAARGGCALHAPAPRPRGR